VVLGGALGTPVDFNSNGHGHRCFRRGRADKSGDRTPKAW